MKRLGLFIFLLLSFVITLTAQQSQSGNPFAELGYKANVATFTSFEEFHDQKQVVEIGGVLFDTRTNEVVGYVDARDSLSGLAPDVISTSIDPFCEKYYSISPYAYCFNNPVKFVDPDGKDGLDVIMGFLAAVVDNASLGAVDKRGSMNYTDAGDYNMGQNLGDVASVVIGGIEGNAGTGTAAGGLALSTSGVGTVVGVPAVEAGAAMATHGSMMMFSGGKNLAEQKGRVAENTETGRSGSTIVNKSGVKVKSYGTGDAHKPAHGHVSGGGKDVRIGPNGKPLKGEPELSPKQNKVVRENIRAVRKEINKVGKENKRIEDEQRRK